MTIVTATKTAWLARDENGTLYEYTTDQIEKAGDQWVVMEDVDGDYEELDVAIDSIKWEDSTPTKVTVTTTYQIEKED